MTELDRQIMKRLKGLSMTEPFKVPERPISFYCVRGWDYKERLIEQGKAYPEPMKHEVCERCAINPKKRGH